MGIKEPLRDYILLSTLLLRVQKVSSSLGIPTHNPTSKGFLDAHWHRKGVLTIEQLVADLLTFTHHLLSPDTLSVVAVVCGAVWKLLDRFNKKQNASQQKFQDELTKRFDKIEEDNKESYHDMQKEILRLQILEGMDAKRLSPSEVRYFYDKYHAFGGNSFVTEKVKKYLEEIEGSADDAQ